MAISSINRNPSPSKENPKTYKRTNPADHLDDVEISKAKGPYLGRSPSVAFALKIGDPRTVIAKYEARPVRIDGDGNPDTYAPATYLLVESHSGEEVGRHSSRRNLASTLFQFALEHAQRLVGVGQVSGIWDRTYRSNPSPQSD